MNAPGTTVVALLGMPNTGKSTLFNRLSGGHAQMGNWSGLTVELLRGRLPADPDGHPFELVDLPGVYDLSGSSEDAAIVQRFLRQTPPDLVVVVVNATQVASQLRLVLQLRDTGLPILLALNMSDEARRFGVRIEHGGLAEALALPVLPVSARRNEGIATLLGAIHLAWRARQVDGMLPLRPIPPAMTASWKRIARSWWSATWPNQSRCCAPKTAALIGCCSIHWWAPCCSWRLCW